MESTAHACVLAPAFARASRFASGPQALALPLLHQLQPNAGEGTGYAWLQALASSDVPVPAAQEAVTAQWPGDQLHQALVPAAAAEAHTRHAECCPCQHGTLPGSHAAEPRG